MFEVEFKKIRLCYSIRNCLQIMVNILFSCKFYILCLSKNIRLAHKDPAQNRIKVFNLQNLITCRK